MPHALSDMMGQPIVNGEKPHSQFLDVRYLPSFHIIHYTLNQTNLLSFPASHFLPRRLRLYLPLQKQPRRRQVHRVR
jgi:hypothetical protein